jgi:hypothetical protein
MNPFSIAVIADVLGPSIAIPVAQALGLSRVWQPPRRAGL